MINYYFNVKATDKHDEELAVYEAKSLEEAKKMFENDHPEDVKNIEGISSDDDFILE